MCVKAATTQLSDFQINPYFDQRTSLISFSNIIRNKKKKNYRFLRLKFIDVSYLGKQLMYNLK